jgi:hypothetical protein
MHGRTTTCGVCGTTMSTPHSGFNVPPACVSLLDGGEDVSPDSITGKVTVNLCSSCDSVVREIVLDDENTPLPACDATAAEWTHRELWAVLAGENPSETTTDADSEALTEQMIAQARRVLARIRRSSAPRVRDSTAIESCIIVLSAHELGLAEDPRPLPAVA